MSSVERIERMNYAIGAILIAIAAFTQPPPIVFGLIAGVVLTSANFYVMRKLITKWTSDAAAGRRGHAPLLMLPKMLALMGAVALVVLVLPVNVIAFTIGYSVFVVSIVIEATYSVLRMPDDESTSNPNEHTHG